MTPSVERCIPHRDLAIFLRRSVAGKFSNHLAGSRQRGASYFHSTKGNAVTKFGGRAHHSKNHFKIAMFLFGRLLPPNSRLDEGIREIIGEVGKGSRWFS